MSASPFQVATLKRQLETAQSTLKQVATAASARHPFTPPSLSAGHIAGVGVESQLMRPAQSLCPLSCQAPDDPEFTSSEERVAWLANAIERLSAGEVRKLAKTTINS